MIKCSGEVSQLSLLPSRQSSMFVGWFSLDLSLTIFDSFQQLDLWHDPANKTSSFVSASRHMTCGGRWHGVGVCPTHMLPRQLSNSDHATDPSRCVSLFDLLMNNEKWFNAIVLGEHLVQFVSSECVETFWIIGGSVVVCLVMIHQVSVTSFISWSLELNISKAYLFWSRQGLAGE